MKPIGFYVCDTTSRSDKKTIDIEIIGSSNTISTLQLSISDALKLVSDVIYQIQKIERQP